MTQPTETLRALLIDFYDIAQLEDRASKTTDPERVEYFNARADDIRPHTAQALRALADHIEAGKTPPVVRAAIEDIPSYV